MPIKPAKAIVARLFATLFALSDEDLRWYFAKKLQP